MELSETTPSQEAFLPTAGIVLSNVDIEAALNKDSLAAVIATDASICEHNPAIIVEKVSVLSSEETNPVDQNTKFEKSHSSDHVSELVKPISNNRSNSDKDLSLNFSSTINEDNALRSLKTGFTNATNALVSPSSPLTRLAKGVQSLSTNLDLRRLRNAEYSHGNFQIFENVKVKEKWNETNCRSKLIAL